MTERASMLTVDGGVNIRDRLIKEFPQVADRPNGEQDLAALLGVSQTVIDELLSDPEVSAMALAEHTKAEIEGKTIEPLARHVALKLLRQIDAEADSVDASEAAALLRAVTRVLENADRVRLAERDKDPYANLPVFNVIINGGHVSATLVEDADLPVIDVDAKVIGGGE